MGAYFGRGLAMAEHENDQARLKSGSATTSYPAVFVVARDGAIRWWYIGNSYTDLPSGEQIEEHIRQLLISDQLVASNA